MHDPIQIMNIYLQVAIPMSTTYSDSHGIEISISRNIY